MPRGPIEERWRAFKPRGGQYVQINYASQALMTMQKVAVHGQYSVLEESNVSFKTMAETSSRAGFDTVGVSGGPMGHLWLHFHIGGRSARVNRTERTVGLTICLGDTTLRLSTDLRLKTVDQAKALSRAWTKTVCAQRPIAAPT